MQSLWLRRKNMVMQSVCQHDVQKTLDGGVRLIGQVVEQVAKTAARQKRGDTCGDDYIVVQEWPILKARADIDADMPIDVSIKRKCFEGVGFIEPERIDVGDRLKLRCQVHVDAAVEKQQTRIDVIGLPLNLA